MGGTWSGQRGWKKPVVENCLALDTGDLKRLNLLVPGIVDRPGTLRWTSKDNHDRESQSWVQYWLTVGENRGTFRFDYQIGEPRVSVQYPVPLVATPCHLGGKRWWFICPLIVNGKACQRRVRKLYLRGRYFACRRCHGLVYRSSQESDSRVYAACRNGTGVPEGGNLQGWSINQLGFALKVFAFQEKKLKRLDERLERHRDRRRTRRDAAKLNGNATRTGGEQ